MEHVYVDFSFYKGLKTKVHTGVNEIQYHCCSLQNYLSFKVLYFYATKKTNTKTQL